MKKCFVIALTLILIVSLSSCSSNGSYMLNSKIEYFEKYKTDEGLYVGYQKETPDTCEAKWYVDGRGRAIIANIIVNGKIVHGKIFHYDSLFEFIRQKRHKEKMLEALQWAEL